MRSFGLTSILTKSKGKSAAINRGSDYFRYPKRIKNAAVILTAVLCVLGILYACLTFEITLQATGGGRLYTEKQCVHLCARVKIRILPSETQPPSALKRITVNGADCTASVHLQTLYIRVYGDTVVTAEFESTAGKAMPANAPTFL